MRIPRLQVNKMKRRPFTLIVAFAGWRVFDRGRRDAGVMIKRRAAIAPSSAVYSGPAREFHIKFLETMPIIIVPFMKTGLLIA